MICEFLKHFRLLIYQDPACRRFVEKTFSVSMIAFTVTFLIFIEIARENIIQYIAKGLNIKI